MSFERGERFLIVGWVLGTGLKLQLPSEGVIGSWCGRVGVKYRYFSEKLGIGNFTSGLK